MSKVSYPVQFYWISLFCFKYFVGDCSTVCPRKSHIPLENKVQSTLKDLHERSVTSIDKTNGSVAFTRKKFCELTLFRELGIPNSQSKKAYKNCKNVQSNLYLANLYIAETYILQKKSAMFWCPLRRGFLIWEYCHTWGPKSILQGFGDITWTKCNL